MPLKKMMPEEDARRLLTAIGETLPIDPEAAAKQFGLTVAYTAADGGESGFVLHENTTRLIGINSKQHRCRQRFAIAHQCGHYSMHMGKSRSIIVCKALRTRTDITVMSLPTVGEDEEANQFALELLMPRDRFKEAFFDLRSDQRENTMRGLADLFDVGTDHVIARAIGLGLMLS